MSFRDMIGRFMRIYGRDNTNERYPLKYGDESTANGIVALEKLFKVFTAIETYKSAYEKVKKEKEALRTAVTYKHIVTPAKNKTEVKHNNNEIERLETELKELIKKQDVDMSNKSTENVAEASKIKAQLKLLRSRRTRLQSQCEAIEANMKFKNAPIAEDLTELAEFFPNINLAKLSEIESFHKKIQAILKDECQMR